MSESFAQDTPQEDVSRACGCLGRDKLPSPETLLDSENSPLQIDMLPFQTEHLAQPSSGQGHTVEKCTETRRRCAQNVQPTEQQTKWVSRTYRLLVCVYSELATEQSSRCPPRVTGSPARLKADCGRSLLRARLPALSVKTSRRAMGRSPQCEGRRTQARYAAPGQSHSFFLWTALHLCAASKVSTKHPRKLLGSGLSLQASAKMPRGFVLLRRHGRPSYRTVRTTSRLLWKKNEAVSQTQYGKWRTRSQPKVLAELLWDGELSLLADLGSCQVFESCLSARHESLLVGMSYHCPHRPGNTPILFI